MRKFLIITLVIIVLAFAGYFVYTNIYQNKVIENNATLNTYSDLRKENTDLVVPNDTPDKVVEKKDSSDTKAQDQIEPKGNITVTYMCEGDVKIIREQDSPSLPPRIFYLRASDDMQIATYGDFGAYIQPEFFNIDRSKIEQGYSFNEENFCKYLKNKDENV
jgi:hypothetical protein